MEDRGACSDASVVRTASRAWTASGRCWRRNRRSKSQVVSAKARQTQLQNGVTSEFCMGLRPTYMDESHLAWMSFDGVAHNTTRTPAYDHLDICTRPESTSRKIAVQVQNQLRGSPNGDCGGSVFSHLGSIVFGKLPNLNLIAGLFSRGS